ncbi:MAG: HesB/IscA family protein [Methanosarcinales archaeon]
MIELTETAAKELKSLLEQENKTDYGLRVYIAGFACSGIQYGLTLDKNKNDDDVVYESNGIKMYVSSDLEQSLDGAEIDYIDNEWGKGFVINNPNASACGSGCSGCY